ncbi:MAG: hypothetical protein A3J09_01200 [Candidatus Zambryskibacteria bacterium RIFCSPLOWO2_02_FULL_51_21]|uniref:M23ase beta-sheet core domain-containing protein n=1 Tax=Candidatus Zambryskibacteria bacterium RIFCSPHIGHO2_02_FULL_43_37 TaxID=1802749 RepID=A0A1G2THN5_9BACT|nr:MAG: hypothetical protein A3D49_01700 [Candidatus Zambryskibacteria bacterium RIFCSPHIGHO2_02_FULL_43_37]OHB11168.1 MAG: hypothetical protein A3J09_01200 [Candidatus Zambryskibacteria bacterium RIFCSPLOWO2_02_FULL_51_21]
MRRFKALIIVSCFLSIVSFARATDPSQISARMEVIRRERETLVAEQRRLETELEAVNRESQNLGTAVKSLDATKKKLATDIKITQSKISSTDLSIKSLENTIGDKEAQINVHQNAIKTALRSISGYDTRPLWIDMLASTNFTDAWRDRSQLEGFSGDLGNEVATLRDTKQELSLEKKKKEAARKQIASLNTELTGQKTVVEASQKAKEKLLAETKNKEAEYQKMIAENLARQAQFEKDIYDLESQLKIALDPSLIPEPRHGVFAWPLDSVFITQKFGKTVGAERLYSSGSHNGVDFRASQGTAVKAVLGGVVEGAGNTDEQRGCYSYGRWILIKHGNGLTSIYAHLSASLVSAGQEIEAGQLIGYSGGTPRTFGAGYSTGPHLHLGVFASQGVSVRQFTQSKGCQQVVVPIVDVKAYLDPLAYLPSL